MDLIKTRRKSIIISNTRRIEDSFNDDRGFKKLTKDSSKAGRMVVQS